MASRSEVRKVFALGLDGATLRRIRPWVSQGELPHFERLMREGVFGPLHSTTPPLTPPAWTSSVTGKNPGKHNIFDFFKPDPKSYERRIVSVHDRKSKAVWNILSEAGKRVGVFNVPITYPPERVNGFVVTGMLTPSGESDFAYPPELKEELMSRVGYRMEVDLRSLVKGEEHQFLKGLSEATENRKEALFYLLERSEWDFFIAVFEALDLAQHFFWRYLGGNDGGQGSSDPKLRQAIRDHYKEMDALLGRLFESLDDRCALLVYSDHGFRPLRKDVFLYNWLEERGFVRLKRNWEGFKVRALKARAFPMRWVKGLFLKDHLGHSHSVAAIDWTKTKAYFFSLSGQSIRVNLKGREAEGVVERGVDYERVCERLRKELSELRDPETHELVVEKVYTREEIYKGDFVENSPDLVVETREGFGLQEGFGAELMMEARQFQTPRSGDHHREGIFMLMGPGIRKGAQLESAEIIDIAPTILYLMGLPVPRDMDGKVVQGAFEEHYLETNPIEFCEETKQGEEGEYEYSEEEREEMERRLKALKYME